MKKPNQLTRISVFFLILLVSLSITGCETAPADSTQTSTQATSTNSSTTSIPSSSSTNTQTTSTTNTDSSVIGLDGEPVSSGNADSAKQELLSRFGITASDSTGETLGDFQIGGGAADSSVYAKVLQVLSTLPESFVRCTSKIVMASSISDNQGPCLGLYDFDTSRLFLTTNDSDFAGTTVHEMTHAFQNKNLAIERQWETQFWNGNSPKSSSVSDYGNTNASEDMAESVREYWQNGAAMKSSQPERYQFVKQFVMGGKEY